MTTADKGAADTSGSDTDPPASAPTDGRDATPDDLLVTAKRGVFFDALRPGDVLLFQGADFLAGLAQLTERRTCYHSAIYLGEWERHPGEHLMAHNVSTLWWRDLAAEVPDEPGGLNLLDGLAGGAVKDQLFERLYDSLEHTYLRNPFNLDPADLHAQAHQLIDKGGVGVVSVDNYLDRVHIEEEYSEVEDRDHPVHHVRSVVALRHRRLRERDAATARATVLAAAERTAEQATGFNSAELLSVVPECLDRPGYSEWQLLSDLAERGDNPKRLAKLLGLSRQGRRADPAREQLRRRLLTVDPTGYFYIRVQGAPGWICASYVVASFAEAGLPLQVGAVRDAELAGPHGPVPLHTPRDLWDCYDLDPVAMFVRGPERWEARSAIASGSAAPSTVAPAAPPGQRRSVVFVDPTGQRDGEVIEVTSGVTVPVITPRSAEERELLQRNAVDWRWGPSPAMAGEVESALTAAVVERNWLRRRRARRHAKRAARTASSTAPRD